MTPMRMFTLAGLCLLATACGPKNEGGLGQEFTSMIQSRFGDKPAAPAALPPALANAAPGDILLVNLIGRNATAPMTRAGQNGAVTTWISPGKVTMAFQDGILVGTRGLGNDLMGATVTGTRAAIAAGGGTGQRRQSYLDSLDQIVSHDLDCTITRFGAETVALTTGPRDLTRYDEACRGRTLVFENSYWVDDTGAIVRSKQAISPTEGFMIADQL